jgi:hypothetical protein
MDYSFLNPVVFHLPYSASIESVQDHVDALHESLEEESFHPNARVSTQEIAEALPRAMAEAQLAFLLSPHAHFIDAQSQGSKFANVEQMNLLQKLLRRPEFVIPHATNISSPHIENFLTQHAQQVLQLWAELGAEYAAYPKDATVPFLQNPECKAKLKNIRASIIAAFELAATNPAIAAQLIPPELTTMIQTLIAEKNYAMVRSTGAEDTRAAANAGGNISVDYVPATQEDILRAMGAVVASYFQKGSLKNRCDAGQNPFQESLQLAVFIQELVGERVLPQPSDGDKVSPKDIVTSFVCFSSEPLYVGNERFRTMRISATYGHGEGVVGTHGINTDYFLILYSDAHPNQLYVIPSIKNKRHRLAPVQQPLGKKPKLMPVPNPKEIAKRPALSQEQLRNIFENALIMEAFFDDKATDFEGICKGNTNFVQARPVNRQPPDANYFDVTKLPASQQTAVLHSLQGNPLVPGRSNVVEISDPHQVIMAEMLEQALKRYKKDQHRLVSVSRPSPALSHAVVNFSYLAVPCVWTPDAQAVQKLLKGVQRDRPLEVCTQTATLYHWNSDVADAATCVTQGFGKHPAKLSPSPLSRSVHVEKSGPVPAEIRALLMQIRSAATGRAALVILNKLRQHPLAAGIRTHAQGNDSGYCGKDHENE